MRKRIKIRFTNGLDFESGVRDILNIVASEYEFVESDSPDFVIFGPYGNDIPAGKCTKIGYYCENIWPDMSICDWAFGMLYEEEVSDARYMHIQWHGFEPSSLIKKDVDVEQIMAGKTRFCNFIFSNSVPYREKFFNQLSKYKRVDAPGRSMNNMPSIDANQVHGDIWSRKRAFLSQYKFTIAFENYSHPGYNTEKLLDPMTVNSLPVYLGNSNIARHFNPKSFINAHDYVEEQGRWLVNALHSSCRLTFTDMRRQRETGFGDKVKRRLKEMGRQVKMSLQFKNFEKLVETIIEVDKNDDLYAAYLSEPWFYNNTPPSNDRAVNRWKEIFG